ncbi:MAG TPA: hypothetical protein VFF69_10825 [Phycisphaerales bacterium]|nr:hypothetical protein [Phycisphaerales bacterium]
MQTEARAAGPVPGFGVVPRGGTPAPLWAVQALAFLGSMGTGVVTNGVFFLSKHACGFSEGENFALGLLMGVTYIAGATAVGPALRRIAARSSAVSTRGVLVSLSLLMGLTAFVPPLAAWWTGDAARVGWSMWLVVGLYSPMSGAFWPLIESYLSGGRSGAGLRRAIGQFNIVWAFAVLASLWAMSPLVREYPLVILVGFGVVQLLSAAAAWPLGSEPGAHLPELHQPHPAVYVPLLTTFRLLLPTSYYVVSVWSPYVPTLLDRLGVGGAWQTGVAATWMLTRFGVFVAMERWHGWHGRWWAVIVGAGAVVGGIALALVAPSVRGGGAVAVVVAGLAVLGVGMGVIYAAALYYAMELGKGEVEAGGAHEALIGVGFAGGPATGLLATGLVEWGLIAEGKLNLIILGTLSASLSVIGILVARRVWLSARAAGIVPGAPERAADEL